LSSSTVIRKQIGLLLIETGHATLPGSDEQADNS